MKLHMRIAVVLGAMTTPCATHADSLFQDGIFNLSEWTITRIMFGNGGTQTEFEQPSGGNPGAFLEVVNNVLDAGGHPFSRILGAYIKDSAVHDPQTEGAITSINYSEDALLISGFGNGQGIRPALEQSGQIFLGPLFTSPDFAWTSKVRLGLQSSDFYLAPETLGIHPDFSANGAPLTFGFARLTTTPANGFTIIGGIDNWRVEVLSVPEPGALGAFAILAFAGAAKRRGGRRMTGSLLQEVMP